jgi:uncharacterized protein (TIGR02246 family)
MRKCVVCAAVAILVATAAGAAPAAQVLPQADRDSVQTLLGVYARATNTGDTALWIDLWDQDGIRVSQDGQVVAGKNAIRQAVRPLIENFTNTLDLTCDDVTLSGNMVFVRGYYSLTARTKMRMEDSVPRWIAGPSPSTLVSAGTFLLVLRRQADGTWKLFRETILEA